MQTRKNLKTNDKKAKKYEPCALEFTVCFIIVGFFFLMGSFIVDRGFSTCLENWTADHIEDAENGIDYSCCHAWSAGPAVSLTELLGVIPVERGYKKVKIQPQLCGLEFIDGAVPTPYGLIKVRADKNGVKYELPEGISLVE